MSMLLPVIAASRRRFAFDPDAVDYFARIATAGSSISANNQAAVNAFIVGCKADGIWSAIKASCFLAGPDDLAGALVPLVGPAPTNVGGSFVSGDYNRTTGLLGDGSTKVLNANRNNNDDPRDNHHQSVWVTTANSAIPNRGYIGSGLSDNGSSHIFTNSDTSITMRSRSQAFRRTEAGVAQSTGLIGSSRAGSNNYVARYNGTFVTFNTISEPALDQATAVFGRNNLAAQADGRLSFYSIGESLDLELLEGRLETYMDSIS